MPDLVIILDFFHWQLADRAFTMCRRPTSKNCKLVNVDAKRKTKILRKESVDWKLFEQVREPMAESSKIENFCQDVVIGHCLESDEGNTDVWRSGLVEGWRTVEPTDERASE